MLYIVRRVFAARVLIDTHTHDKALVFRLFMEFPPMRIVHLQDAYPG